MSLKVSNFMNQSTALFQFLFSQWWLSTTTGMWFGVASGTDGIVFEGYEGLFSLNDKVRKHRFQKVCAFSGLCRPSPQRLTQATTFQWWIPILRTISDYPAACFLNVRENFMVRVRDAYGKATVRVHGSLAGICNRSFVNANTAFAIEESGEVTSINRCYVE